MDTRTNIINKLKNFKKKLGKDFKIQDIIFFGSRAKGKPHKYSDIDLLIVSQKFTKFDFIERGAKMYDYWNLDYPVDFLCYTPKEFNKLKKQASIVSEAIKKGIEI